jgi:hypothetical protein
MSKQVCGNCRWHDVDGFYAFYRGNAEGMGDMGFCRCGPPLPDFTRLLTPGMETVLRTELLVFAVWPETSEEAWCGAWAPCERPSPEEKGTTP